MLYPLPAVMVSVRGKNGEDNIITVAWAGTVCDESSDGIDLGAAGTLQLSDVKEGGSSTTRRRG